MNGRELNKMALRVLIGAVGLSAVLGIFALLRWDLDEWSAKTLSTTLFVSAASLLIMVNAAGIEKRSVGYLLISGTGLLAALGALAGLLAAGWLARRRWAVEICGLLGGHLDIRGSLCIYIAPPAICPIPMPHAHRHVKLEASGWAAAVVTRSVSCEVARISRGAATSNGLGREPQVIVVETGFLAPEGNAVKHFDSVKLGFRDS